MKLEVDDRAARSRRSFENVRRNLVARGFFRLEGDGARCFRLRKALNNTGAAHAMRWDRPELRRPGRALLLAAHLATAACGYDDRAVPCDADGDGHSIARCGGDDCDDRNADVHPGAADPVDLVWHVETVPAASFGYLDGAMGADELPYVLFSEFIATEGCPVPGFVDGLPFCEWSITLARRTPLAWERVYVWDDEDMDYPPSGEVALEMSPGRIHVLPQYRWSPDDVIDWTLAPIPPAPDLPVLSFQSFDFEVDGESGNVAFVLGRHAAVLVPGAEWTWETMDADPGATTPSSVAWDGAAGLHACWITYDPPSLRYARRIDPGWTVESIDGTDASATRCNLAVAPDGSIRLSYLTGSLTGPVAVLNVVSNASGSWQVVPVQEGVSGLARAPGDWIAVGVDGSTHVAVSVRVEGTGGCPVGGACTALLHGSDRGGAWTFEELLSSQCCQEDFGLGLDSAGRAHVFFEAPGTDPTVAYEARYAVEVDAVDEACDGP